MTDTASQNRLQGSVERFCIFDAPADLAPVFRENGFLPYGRQPGAWVRLLDPASDEARDIEYEARGVGLNCKWYPA